MRDGRLVGGILMGDISKAAYLMQAFDRDSPLPDERLSLLFDLGAPPQKVTLDEMPAEAQVCNCNGVSKAAIGAAVAAGNRSADGGHERDPRRQGLRLLQGAGRRCRRLVRRRHGGGGPLGPLLRPDHPDAEAELIEAIRARGLKSVSAVFRALGGGVEDAGRKPAGLAA